MTVVALGQCSIEHNASGLTKTLEQAKAAGWIGLPMYQYDSATRGYQRCGFDPWDNTQVLTAWRGYWLRVNTADLTLIIPAP